MAEKEKEITEDVIDVDAKIADAVAPAVAAALKADREAVAQAEADEKEAAKAQLDLLANAATEAATEANAEMRERFGVPEDVEDDKLDEWIAGQNKAKGRPLAPSSGAPEADSTRISVGSEFDHVDTFDLALRYETMKTFGGQPSDRFLGALADRAQKMAGEEDTLYIKNGQAVKVPAIDWAAVKPVPLTTEELRAENGRPGADKTSDVISKHGYEQFRKVAQKTELMFSTDAGFGDEWVPTLMNAQLWRTVRLNAAVLGLFEQFEMPSQPYVLPTESTDPTIYKVPEATAQSQMAATAPSFIDSKIGTAAITFSAGKMGALSYWSEEQEEDGIIAFEPQIRDQYGLAIAHGIDEILISGDETTATANIVNDGATQAATSRFLVLDGLRHQPLVTTTADKRDAGALTIDDFGATAALLGVAGKWGLNPADLVWLMDGGVWHKARLLGEVLTQDKFGAMATVFNGQLGSLFGSPIIVSENYALTAADGNIDNSGGSNTKGSFLCVNKRFVKVGWRRRPRIRVERLPFSDAAYIVGSSRFDIGFKEAGGVGISYNVTV